VLECELNHLNLELRVKDELLKQSSMDMIDTSSPSIMSSTIIESIRDDNKDKAKNDRAI
jgi:hypothetical protein